MMDSSPSSLADCTLVLAASGHGIADPGFHPDQNDAIQPVNGLESMAIICNNHILMECYSDFNGML